MPGVSGLSGLLRLAKALPDCVELVQAAQRAAQGDPEAAEYLRKDGWKQALDVAVRPGAGEAGERAIAAVRDVFTDNGVINGEFREMDRYPWTGFCNRLLAQTSGGHILLGPEGAGKTTLAIKLAYLWHITHGWPVEWIGLYPDDVPDFGAKVHIDTLVHRMGALSEYLKAEGVDDPVSYIMGEDDEDGKPRKKRKRYRPIMPPQRRIIVIDEMGMAVTTSAHDPRRQAALQYIAQSRHVNSLVLFLAQYAGQVPEVLLGKCTVWVKQPRGDEKDADRDNKICRQAWEEAELAFAGLRRQPWYAPPHDNVQSWAYVRCKALTNGPGYTGMVPFIRYEPGMVAAAPIEGEFTEIS